MLRIIFRNWVGEKRENERNGHETVVQEGNVVQLETVVDAQFHEGIEIGGDSGIDDAVGGGVGNGGRGRFVVELNRGVRVADDGGGTIRGELKEGRIQRIHQPQTAAQEVAPGGRIVVRCLC